MNNTLKDIQGFIKGIVYSWNTQTLSATLENEANRKSSKQEVESRVTIHSPYLLLCDAKGSDNLENPKRRVGCPKLVLAGCLTIGGVAAFGDCALAQNTITPDKTLGTNTSRLRRWEVREMSELPQLPTYHSIWF